MSDGDPSAFEAHHIQAQEAADLGPDVSEGEAHDELNDANDPSQIGDALAAHHMDKHNQGGPTAKFTSAVKKSASWIRKNGMSYIGLTATSSGIGIAITELANRADILNHSPVQRGVTYALGLAVGYKTVKAGRYAGHIYAIMKAVNSDGITRTPLVDDFEYFRKRFGKNKRYTDLQKREAGTLKGRVIASAFIAATMPAWPSIGSLAGWTVMNIPDAVSNTYNFVGNGVDGNRARVEQAARGAQDSLRIFTPEIYDEKYLPLTPGGQEEISALDEAGNVVTLKLIYAENALGSEENAPTNDNSVNDVEGTPKVTSALEPLLGDSVDVIAEQPEIVVPDDVIGASTPDGP